jgi:LPS sulfotransferase NodH
LIEQVFVGLKGLVRSPIVRKTIPMTTKFMIVGTQRTGTTWIRTTLCSHPSVQAFGEVFLYSHGRLPLFRTAGKDVVQSYGTYIDHSPWRKIMHFVRRRAIVEEYLDQLYADSSAGATGFKFMRTQAKQFPSVIQYAMEHRIKIVHVVRENVLKTYISRETAKQRRIAHCTQSLPVEQITVPTDFLVKKLDQIASDNFAWECIFSAAPYLKLVYEEFVDHKVQELSRLFTFLSVPQDQTVSSSLVKINPHAIRDVVINFADVSRCLKGTPYEWCLNE